LRCHDDVTSDPSTLKIWVWYHQPPDAGRIALVSNGRHPLSDEKRIGGAFFIVTRRVTPAVEL